MAASAAIALRAPAAPRFLLSHAGGCHPARDTTAAIQRAGFDIETIDRFGFAASNTEPSVPHILGIARRF